VAFAAASLGAQVNARTTQAAQAAADLAARYYTAGNITELDLRREEALASEARVGFLARQAQLAQVRAQLTSLLGLRGDDPRAQFDARLLMPAAADLDVAALQRTALEQRLDLLALRTQVQLRQQELTHVRRWRWLPGADLRLERESETGSPTLSGVGGSLELPLFNTGAGQLGRAEAGLAQREARLAALEIETVNSVAAQHATLAAAQQAVAEFNEVLLGLRDRIVQLTQQQHDFMLGGSLELIAARRAQLEAYDAYIEAIAGYWRARVGLNRAVGGRLAIEPASERVGVENLP
jgi:cobalt-zinc-cadmium efflux system outer membrane protein